MSFFWRKTKTTSKNNEAKTEAMDFGEEALAASGEETTVASENEDEKDDTHAGEVKQYQMQKSPYTFPVFKFVAHISDCLSTLPPCLIHLIIQCFPMIQQTFCDNPEEGNNELKTPGRRFMPLYTIQQEKQLHVVLYPTPLTDICDFCNEHYLPTSQAYQLLELFGKNPDNFDQGTCFDFGMKTGRRYCTKLAKPIAKPMIVKRSGNQLDTLLFKKTEMFGK
jgi:hypothetical protein